MTLLEAIMASLLLMLASSAAGQVWSEGLRVSGRVAQREERAQTLDALLLASEGSVRDLAATQGPASDCQDAIAQLPPLLSSLPNPRQATLSLPASPAGTVHVRWELAGMRRERLWSVTALRLCQETGHGT